MPHSPHHNRVIQLYKQLVYLGHEYPAGYQMFFRPRLKAAFMKQKDLKDEIEIQRACEKGEFVVKELEAMYFLRKYRAMKRRYGIEDQKIPTPYAEYLQE